MFLNLLTCTCLVTLLAYICTSLHNAYNPVHLVQSTNHLKVGATIEIEAKENHVDHANYFLSDFSVAMQSGATALILGLHQRRVRILQFKVRFSSFPFKP